MKIKSVEVDNHPVLGTFHYKFEDEKPIVLFVGKNGSGKTKFVEFLHTLLDKCFRIWEIPDWHGSESSRIKLSVFLNDEECADLAQTKLRNNQVIPDLSSGELYFETTQKTGGWDDFEVYVFDRGEDDYVKLPKLLKQTLVNNQVFGEILRSKSRYSSVQINFGYKPVTSFAEIVDDDSKIQTKSNPDLADEINKLLVSTYNRDCSYLAEESRKGLAHPEYKGDFDRFKDAYEELFESKEILKVEQDGDDNKITILDKKTGREFGIDGLSSGEQQVVYRVGYLLRNLNIKTGGVVFIDEPELSLHPEWQTGYIQFLQSIFGDNIQFVIATHSPYIVKSGIDDEKVSVSMLQIAQDGLKDEKLHHTSKLGKATFAEVNYKAFGITSEEFHTELYLALQRTYAPEQWIPTRGASGAWVGGMPSNLDTELSSNQGVPLSKSWTESGTNRSRSETLMTYIRNIIHHGGDAINRGRSHGYNEADLKQSIEEMLRLL